MRKLAHSLVGDAQRADDLAQDTWVRALEHRPRTDQPLRGWLATVMRNVLRQERRGDGRRRNREERVAQSVEAATDESGLAVLARVTMQRELVETVLTLDEPYRTTVLLRYFEELSPKRIAEEHGVPVSTVKTRLARGLERLRGKLDAEHGGDGKAWVVALAPVLRKPSGLGPAFPSSLTLGALAVNTKTLLLAATLSVIGAGYFLSRRGADGGLPAQEVSGTASTPAPASARAAVESAGGVALAQEAPHKRRALVAGGAPEGASLGAVEGAGITVKGRVVDITGRPIAGLEIVSQRPSTGANSSTSASATVLGTSGDDGTFTLRVESSAGLVVRDPDYTTVMMASAVDEAMGKEPILVVAPRIRLAGLVVDEFGAAMGAARITLVPPASLRADLGWVLDYSLELPFVAESDQDGRFELAEAPSFRDGVLHGKAEGTFQASVPAPSSTHLELLLVLERPALLDNVLRGVVLDVRGFPVPGASVSLGIDTTASDDSGAFSFDLTDPDSFNRMLSDFVQLDGRELLALKEGHLPARLSARDTDADGRPVWPEHVVLRLGEQPLSIQGRVLDEQGRPLANMRVWLEDPTFFGGFREEGRSWPRMTHVESQLAGLDPGWPFVQSDRAGKFQLRGLMEREYELAAMDPETLMRTGKLGVRAGATGVELVLSHEDAWDVIRGRVVDGRGKPVEGASVRVSCDAFRTRIQGQVVGTRHASGASIVTDGQGRFELRDVPKESAYFRIDHPGTIPCEVGRSEQALRALVGEEHEDFTLVVMRRCHFQVELADPSEANEFEVHDLQGSVLQLSEFEGNGRRDGYRFPLTDGRTNILAVGDSAATLVLYADGQEVKRVSIELSPGEQPTLRP